MQLSARYKLIDGVPSRLVIMKHSELLSLSRIEELNSSFSIFMELRKIFNFIFSADTLTL